MSLSINHLLFSKKQGDILKTIYIKNHDIIRLPKPVCAAIGNFDGVHLGHQKLIEECKRHGYKSAVLTFYPHPSVFLKKIPNYPLVTPIEHKIDIIGRMGIDYLIIVEFNDEVKDISKEDFMQMMKQMNIVSCVCGYDFTFGKKALGNIRDLDKHFEFYEIKKYVFDDVRVSTTYIRELLQVGDVKMAARLLGRNYSIRGEVIHGSALGRIIGFPTANIEYSNYFLPANGVYFVTVNIDNNLYFGMCNIGNNPTFNYSHNKRVEVNIFGLNVDLYGKKIEVSFYDKIREEKQFKNKEELIEQLNKDKTYCYQLSKNINLTK